MHLLTWIPASGAERVTDHTHSLLTTCGFARASCDSCLPRYFHAQEPSIPQVTSSFHSFLYTSPCVNAHSPPIISYTSRPPGPALIVFKASMACLTCGLLRWYCTQIVE